MKRLLLAFLVAPAVIPLLTLIFIVVMGGSELAKSFSAGYKVAIMVGVLTYAATVFIGLPFYLVFRVFRWFSFWQFALGGGICGVILLAFFGGFNKGLPAPLVATHAFEYAAIGAISASMFFFAGIWKNKKLIEPNKPLNARRAEEPRAH